MTTIVTPDSSVVKADTHKEHPILFSGPMIRAILSGAKTQTRRVIKPQPDGFWHTTGEPVKRSIRFAGEINRIHCPYGAAGDRLWVRETWLSYPLDRDQSEIEVLYRATDDSDDVTYTWKPSIHMPRRASRITLEITDVRAERVQDISEADAMAEGYSEDEGKTAQDWFRDLWDSINGKRPGCSWQDNPWVWAVSFQRVTTAESEAQ